MTGRCCHLGQRVVLVLLAVAGPDLSSRTAAGQGSPCRGLQLRQQHAQAAQLGRRAGCASAASHLRGWGGACRVQVPKLVEPLHGHEITVPQLQLVHALVALITLERPLHAHLQGATVAELGGAGAEWPWSSILISAKCAAPRHTTRGEGHSVYLKIARARSSAAPLGCRGAERQGDDGLRTRHRRAVACLGIAFEKLWARCDQERRGGTVCWRKPSKRNSSSAWKPTPPPDG